MYEGMCIRAFYKLPWDSIVSSTVEKALSCLETLSCGIFSLHNAVLSTSFGSTVRLHDFSAVHYLRAHASCLVF